MLVITGAIAATASAATQTINMQENTNRENLV
jgi:hypothetical protein